METNTYEISCTGDVVVGDIIQFKEGVFGGSYRKPTYLGERVIEARVINDSYGECKQQHTFTIEVVASSGYLPLKAGLKTTRKGRNIYRNGTFRQEWADESVREIACDEKHVRGGIARRERAERRQIAWY